MLTAGRYGFYSGNSGTTRRCHVDAWNAEGNATDNVLIGTGWQEGNIVPSIRRFAAEPSIVFYPRAGSWSNQYRLHQFRGMMRARYPLTQPTIYVDYSQDHTNYPLNVTFGGAAGPGGRDNVAAAGSPALDWYYVYLIAKADGTLSLVYSNSGRNPWSQGPLLDSSSYNFPGNGWIYWKFIAAVRNGQSNSWQIVPMRKIGNHIEYEQAQRLLNRSGGGVGVTALSLSSRIPPTSLRANILLAAQSDYDGGHMIRVRPRSGGAASTMPLQDTTPSSPMSLLEGGIPGWKGVCEVRYGGSTDAQADWNTFWCDTDNAQQIEYRVDTPGGSGTRGQQLYVQGYIEYTDTTGTNLTYN